MNTDEHRFRNQNRVSDLNPQSHLCLSVCICGSILPSPKQIPSRLVRKIRPDNPGKVLDGIPPVPLYSPPESCVEALQAEFFPGAGRIEKSWSIACCSGLRCSRR